MEDDLKDCSDFSKECSDMPRHKKKYDISSNHQLIGNPVLRGIIWSIGIMALSGNLVSYLQYR